MRLQKRSQWLWVGLVWAMAACTVGNTPTPDPTATAMATATRAPGPTATTTVALPTVTPSPVPSPLPSPLPSATAAPVAQLYVVQPGDTLLGIALMYQVPMAAIQLSNGMGDSVVQVGQTLEIPAAAGWEGASPYWSVHQVQPGETLWGIAADYGIDPARLQAVNGLTDVDLVTAGQPLILPTDDGTVVVVVPTPVPPTATPFPVATPISAATPLSEATATPAATPAVIPPPADVTDWPQETVRLINEVRAGYNLPPLAYNETLALAAQGQANDCSQRGWCSHTGSDGSDVKARIIRVGYNPSSWAECWAQRQTPQDTVAVWMNETPPDDPHRRTLLSTWLTEIGLGVAETDWGYYFIADFGKPRN